MNTTLLSAADDIRQGKRTPVDVLEECLARYVSRGVAGLCDGILADLARFTGNLPREDDQTLLVLRLP